MEVKVVERKCDHCGHEWTARTPNPGVCPKCGKIITRDYRTERSRYMTDYSRANFVGVVIDGKTVRVRVKGKRPHPGRCELCGADRKLGYHHWDDDKLSVGIWLCDYCHKFAEVVDNAVKENVDLVRIYLEMKERIKLGFAGVHIEQDRVF